MSTSKIAKYNVDPFYGRPGRPRPMGRLARQKIKRQREIAYRQATGVDPVCSHEDTGFDRHICIVDEWMHTYCRKCTRILDGVCGESINCDPRFDFLRAPHDRVRG